jgi:hypothetical protein
MSTIPLNLLITRLKNGDVRHLLSQEGETYTVTVPPSRLERLAADHLIKLNQSLERMTNLALQLQAENDKLLAQLIEKGNQSDQEKIQH